MAVYAAGWRLKAVCGCCAGGVRRCTMVYVCSAVALHTQSYRYARVSDWWWCMMDNDVYHGGVLFGGGKVPQFGNEIM